MLVLMRHYQFWYCMVALHKLGAIAIPATNQLKEHDFSYRYNAAGVSAIGCTADGDTADIAKRNAKDKTTDKTNKMVNRVRAGPSGYQTGRWIWSTFIPTAILTPEIPLPPKPTSSPSQGWMPGA